MVVEDKNQHSSNISNPFGFGDAYSFSSMHEKCDPVCVCVCVNGASLLGKDHSSMWVSASAVSQLQDLTKAVY